MNTSRRILAVAALAVLGLAIASESVGWLNGRAHAEAPGAQADPAADRIGGAFASIPRIEPDRAIEAAAVRVQKGDLFARPGCSGEKWPEIASDCLVMADGSAAPAIRYVTLGYRTGEATSVLIRMPAPQMVSR